MKQTWKKGTAIIMAVAMLGCVVDQFPQSAQSAVRETLAAEKADAAQAYSTDELQPDMTGNLNAQDYHTYGEVVTSYLVAEEGGYMRVQFLPREDAGSSDDLQIYEPKRDLIVVEHYDGQFQLKSQQYIDEEQKLDRLVGFYAGRDNYYVVWKQRLDEKTWSADQVFMRVMKYDKDWQFQDKCDLNSNNGGFLGLGSGGLNNGGVVNPCNAGSLNMTEYEGHLYINSCYTGVDGHQRSMMFDILESDMSPVQTTYDVAAYYAWVSHSYNQFLLVDDGLSPKRMVTLNHGDGMKNRGAALGQYELDTKYEILGKDINKEINTFPCAGGEFINDNVRNYTGASLGGLERTANSYVVAGNSIEQAEETFLTVGQRNIFVTATSRTDFSIENTKVYWLTDYTEDAQIEISTPQLVKMSEDRILVMWREGKQIPHETGKLMYRFLDADGKPLEETKTADGEISGCKPIVKDGKAVWYSSSVDEGVYFYTIDSQGTFEAHGVNTVAGVPTVNKVEFRENGVHLEWEPVDGADGYCIVRNIKPDKELPKGDHFMVVLTNYELTYVDGGSTCSYLDQSEYTDGFLYEYRVCSYEIRNGRKILSYGCDQIEQWLFKGVQYFSTVENVASGVKLSWKPYNPYFNPSEFRIYRSEAGMADAKLIGTVKGAADRYSKDSVESFIDTTAEGGAVYDYSIETCRDEGVSARFKVYSFLRVESPQVSAVCNPDNTVTVSWSKAIGAKNYYLRPYIWSEGRQAYIQADVEQTMSPDNLSCTVSGLQKGTKYQFGIIGKSEFIRTPSMTMACGFDSEEVKAEITTYENPTETKLQPPLIISAESIDQGIKLKWNPVEGADGYEIFIEDSMQGAKNVNGTMYIDKDVTEGVFYTYRVRAYVQKAGTKTYSEWSEAKKVKYEMLVPTAKPTAEPTSKPTAKPTSKPTAKPTLKPTPAVKLPAPEITSVVSTQEGVVLSWNEVKDAAGYWVYYYDVDSGEATLAGKTSWLSYTDQNVEDGKNYHYVVYAWTADGELYISGQSNIVSIQYKKLKVPVLKSLTCLEDGVKVEWEPVEDADGYYVYYYEEGSSDGLWTTGKIAGGDVNSSIVSYIPGTHGKRYCYYVKAYRIADTIEMYSEQSNVKDISIQIPEATATPTPTPALSAPDLKSFTCFRSKYGDGIELTWDPVEDADGYYIFAYEDGVEMLGQSIVGGDTTSHSFIHLKENSTYLFYMRAYKKDDHDPSGRIVSASSGKKSIVFITPPEAADPSPEVPSPTPGSISTPEPGQTIPPHPGPTSTATPANTLAVPKLLEVKCVSDGVKITWEASEGADGYFVSCYNEKTPDSIWTDKLEGHDTVSYVHSSGIEGQRYVYSVSAYKSTDIFEVSEESESRSIIYQKQGTSSTQPYVTPTPGGEGTLFPEPTLQPKPLDIPGPGSLDTPNPGPTRTEPTLQPEPTKESQSTVQSEGKKLGKPSIKKLKNKSVKKVTVTLSKKVSGADGYQVAYAVKPSMKGKKTKLFKGTGVTIKGLKNKKTYYFRVRAFVKINGNIVYGSWGKKKKIKIKK